RNVGLGDRVFLLRGVDERRSPLRELLGVIVVAGYTGDDEDVGLLGERRHRRKPTTQERSANEPQSTLNPQRKNSLGALCDLCGYMSSHASPLARRNPHSANTRLTSSRNSTGMSHSSRSSTTVTPRPL